MLKQFYIETLLDSTALPADKALLQLDTRTKGIPQKRGSQMNNVQTHMDDVS